MPGPIAHVGAQATCPHGGQATITSTSRVLLSGQPMATIAAPSTVTGCAFQISTPGGPKPQPCVLAQWTVGATRVFVDGQPALIQSSTGICQSAEQIPQGPPTVVSTQIRVTAT